MQTPAIILIAWLSMIALQVCAFQEKTVISNRHRNISVRTFMRDRKSIDNQCENSQARRSFLDKAFFFQCGVVFTALTTKPELAHSSGGATAGGAYLLSAKRRYYDRVKTSVLGLIRVADGLKNGDSAIAKDFFSSETDGSWNDLTAAGYLLSNAFRRSASTNPDSLPAVKKYKAFVKEVNNFQKVLKKKGAAAAAEEFSNNVEVALDAWLSEIQLPAAREL